MANTCPIHVQNVSMTGDFVSITIHPEYNTVILQMRTAVDMQIRQPSISKYFTVKSGNSISLASFNFTEAEYVEVKAANGTVLEVLGMVRS